MKKEKRHIEREPSTTGKELKKGQPPNTVAIAVVILWYSWPLDKKVRCSTPGNAWNFYNVKSQYSAPTAVANDVIC